MTLVQTSNLGYDQDAWDAMTYYAFRPQLFFERFATVKPTKQTMPGATVSFTFTDDLEPATTPLTEDEDVTPQTLSDTKLQVTLAEYGNAVKRTAFLYAVSYIPLDPAVAEAVGWNAGLSMDTIVSNELHGGDNVKRPGDVARNALDDEDLITAAIVRREVAALRRDNVPTWDGSHYAVSIHPDVSVDLREETGAAAWREPHTYVKVSDIWNGEIGSFEGARFIETPRAAVFAGGGAETGTDTDLFYDVYGTLFFGKQCLAKAFPKVAGFGDRPRVRPTPVTDNLHRFVGMGWYHVAGYARFREESLRRVETASSIGATTDMS